MTDAQFKMGREMRQRYDRCTIQDGEGESRQNEQCKMGMKIRKTDAEFKMGRKISKK